MKKYRILDILLYLVFVFYLILLLAILFRTRHTVRSLNLIPLQSIHAYMAGDSKVVRAFALINILGNIVIFVPLGVYFTLFNRRKTVLWIFLFSVIVEIIQYVFKIGIGDIDDVILNVLGGVIGIGLYQILWWIFKDKNKIWNIIAICAPILGILSFAILMFINR